MAVVALEDIAGVALPDVEETRRRDWCAEQKQLGARIAALRRYAEGDHPANMTKEMRAALRIGSDEFDEFTDNYMDIIIQTMADRLRVIGFDAEKDAAEWIAEWMVDNRFDGLQADVHEAAVRDGDTFLMVYFDNLTRRARISHEQAYDGTTGMMVYYDSTADAAPLCAIKVWSIGATTRVNVYRDGVVERYQSVDGTPLTPMETPDDGRWQTVQGQPLGLPVFHMRNRNRTGTNYGRSELRDAIALQNALNRTLYSMVFSAELSAFMIRFAKGFEPPSAVTPGMWITAGFRDGNGKVTSPTTADEAAALGAVEASALEQAELVPYLDMARWLKGEISFVTRTPAPEFMGGDNESGEALKQRETGLIGKVERFQIKGGNVWEDVVTLCARVEAAYSDAPPELGRVSARWRDAQLRNDVEQIDNALKVADRVGDREFLRLIAPVYGWDDGKVNAILDERETDATRAITSAGAMLPSFSMSETVIGEEDNG